MKRLTRNLRNSSIEAFILALETINRPTIQYRMEAFCILFCNAWELVTKARLLDRGDKFREIVNKPRKSRLIANFIEMLEKNELSEQKEFKWVIKILNEQPTLKQTKSP